METGVLIHWGKVIPDREEKAIELFNEVFTYYREQKEAGVITFFEPFMYATQEGGYFFVKAPAETIYRLIEEEPFRDFVVRAALLVEGFKWDLMVVGDGIFTEMERYAKAHAALGLL